MAKPLQLRDGENKLVCTLTVDEARRMKAAGTIDKINRNSFRLKTAPTPSNSGGSASCLTGGNCRKGDGGDMLALAGTNFAGGKLKPHLRERIAGHLLMPRLRVSVQVA